MILIPKPTHNQRVQLQAFDEGNKQQQCQNIYDTTKQKIKIKGWVGSEP